MYKAWILKYSLLHNNCPNPLPGGLDQSYVPLGFPCQLRVSVGQLFSSFSQPQLTVLQGLELLFQLLQQPQPEKKTHRKLLKQHSTLEISFTLCIKITKTEINFNKTYIDIRI